MPNGHRLALPPGPRGHRLLGSLREVRRDRLGFVVNTVRRYGDLVGIRLGSRRLLLLNHPDLIREVLVANSAGYGPGVGLAEARFVLGTGILTSGGDTAARLRERLGHLFEADRLAACVPEVAATITATLDGWRPAARDGRPVDLARGAYRLAFACAGRALLGVDLAPFADEAIQAFQEMGRSSIGRMAAVGPLPVWLPTPANLRLRRARRKLTRLAHEILAGPPPPRNLDCLRAEPPASPLAQQLLTLLLAGHETTGTALSWTCDLLARHPEAQVRAREEILARLGSRETPSAADLQALPFTRSVLDESLRLFPPVWMITRCALRPSSLGGYAVPAGTQLLMPIFTLHRNPEVWPCPEEFRPERFSPEAAPRPPLSYLPFGAGPRACLGAGLARLEVLTSLVLILRAFRLHPVPGPPVRPDPLLTLRPKGPLLLRLEALD